MLLRAPRSRWPILAVAWFFLLLAVPAVAGLAGARPRNIDNRGLARFPATTATDLLDRDHYAAIDRWAADHLPLRDRAITLQSRLDQDVFKDTGQVLVGRAGWLFLAAEVEGGCNPQVGEAALVDAVRRGTATASQRHVPVVWMIVPDKATAMPSLVRSDRIGCAVAHHRTLDRAIARAKLPVVFPNDDLAAGLDNPGGPPLWWQGDTHQTSWGHLVEVRRTLDRLAPGLYDTSSVERETTTDDGDLWRLLGQPRTETIEGAVVRRPHTQTVARAPQAVGAGLALQRYTSTGPDRRLPGRTVIVHDSHFDGSQQLLLAPWFDDVTFIPTGAIDTPAARSAVAHADRLIVEGVERGRQVLAQEIPELADRLSPH